MITETQIRNALRLKGYSYDNSPIGDAHVQLVKAVLSVFKDNPVPSLYELLAEKVGAESAEYEHICKIINGVETDKEQPYPLKIKLNYYMLDSKDQPNDYLKARILPHPKPNYVKVEWANNKSAVGMLKDFIIQ